MHIDKEFSIQPGKYIYPFECNLSIKLPSSIEGEHGHIRYKVSLIIDRHLWPNKSYTEGFTVFKRMDLNDCQMYQVNLHLIHFYVLKKKLEINVINSLLATNYKIFTRRFWINLLLLFK